MGMNKRQYDEIMRELKAITELLASGNTTRRASLAEEKLRRSSTYGKPLELIDTAAPAPVAGTDVEALQARADYNRENAAQLFSDALIYDGHAHRWIVRLAHPGNDSGKPVVFTPYGWIVDPDAT